ncbi:MAG TPA: hypothetical protein VFB43_06740 [Terracidiphilus sp.]|nr:hypothetical protein [Terracidiphilus sp.]
MISPNIQQLLSDRVFGREAILHVSLEENLVPDTAFQNIVTMVPIEIHQRFGRDAVQTPLPVTDNRRLEPPLLNPEDNLCPTNVEHASQAFNGEQIAAKLLQAEMISP